MKLSLKWADLKRSEGLRASRPRTWQANFWNSFNKTTILLKNKSQFLEMVRKRAKWASHSLLSKPSFRPLPAYPTSLTDESPSSTTSLSTSSWAVTWCTQEWFKDWRLQRSKEVTFMLAYGTTRWSGTTEAPSIRFKEPRNVCFWLWVSNTLTMWSLVHLTLSLMTLSRAWTSPRWCMSSQERTRSSLNTQTSTRLRYQRHRTSL